MSGHACPGAKDCLAYAILTKGKLTLEDGPDTKFRCYSASQEAQYPGVYDSRKHNLDLLKKNKGDVNKLFEIMNSSLPKDAQIVRFFVAGDTFCDNLMKAQIRLAKANPSVLFYQYTKSIPLWLKNKKDFPKNYVMTASYGGKWDKLIKKNRLKAAEVVFSEKEAVSKGLEIDHDDSHALLGKKSFALLIHGTQPPGSLASKAWTKIKLGLAV